MGRRLRMSDTAFYLSDEIIEKILSRLPLKSLLKYKMVCRPWDSLIRDRHFIYMHLSHSIDNPNYLIGVTNSENLKLYLLEDDGESECKITNIPFPVCKKLKFATFVGSACGWVCLNDLWSDDVHICNPATGQAITLSKDGQQPRIGFGIGQESDEYVVCQIFENIQVNDVNHPYDCEIYSSKTCSWKHICSIPYDIDSYVYAFANGAFHWYNGSDAIISVDIKEEKENVRFTQLPESIVNAVIFLDEWRGSLAVFVVKGLEVKVWILKDCGESSWTKK
ncbi:F-box/kelch-repeat protein At3g23880-like [Magnolia sinica]|uniref:F-box/kelch-repeat protein At3g23880-like n=1 Tax=Magnolia sinica TaxID=86752 RepID=UPI0026582A3A|nr:F-box/kelch-repeat protein At3g23880-like [Magnolia sinica]